MAAPYVTITPDFSFDPSGVPIIEVSPSEKKSIYDSSCCLVTTSEWNPQNESSLVLAATKKKLD